MAEACGETKLINRYGFHIRPSTTFAELARKYSSIITVTANGKTTDAKSPLGLMQLSVRQGTVIKIFACGDDAAIAVQALQDHVDSRFGGIE